MQEDTQSTQPTLEELKIKLENWRANKRNHREPIPKQLWKAAADLAKDGSINQVSKTLHLSYADLKYHIYGPSVPKHKIKQKDISFIEIKPSQPLSETPVTVDIENKKGARMRICFGTTTDIATLIKSFL
jgi:hypothetical protein